MEDNTKTWKNHIGNLESRLDEAIELREAIDKKNSDSDLHMLKNVNSAVAHVSKLIVSECDKAFLNYDADIKDPGTELQKLVNTIANIRSIALEYSTAYRIEYEKKISQNSVVSAIVDSISEKIETMSTKIESQKKIADNIDQGRQPGIRQPGDRPEKIGNIQEVKSLKMSD